MVTQPGISSILSLNSSHLVYSSISISFKSPPNFFLFLPNTADTNRTYPDHKNLHLYLQILRGSSGTVCGP